MLHVMSEMDAIILICYDATMSSNHYSQKSNVRIMRIRQHWPCRGHVEMHYRCIIYRSSIGFFRYIPDTSPIDTRYMSDTYPIDDW